MNPGCLSQCFWLKMLIGTYCLISRLLRSQNVIKINKNPSKVDQARPTTENLFMCIAVLTVRCRGRGRVLERLGWPQHPQSSQREEPRPLQGPPPCPEEDKDRLLMLLTIYRPITDMKRGRVYIATASLPPTLRWDGSELRTEMNQFVGGQHVWRHHRKKKNTKISFLCCWTSLFCCSSLRAHQSS